MTGSSVNNTAFNICFWNINGRWTFLKDDNIIKWINLVISTNTKGLM